MVLVVPRPKGHADSPLPRPCLSPTPRPINVDRGECFSIFGTGKGSRYLGPVSGCRPDANATEGSQGLQRLFFPLSVSLSNEVTPVAHIIT